MPENAETNRLKVAIIGCGRVSEKHIRAVTGLSDRLMLCALADTNPDAPSHLLKACKKKIKKYNEVVKKKKQAEKVKARNAKKAGKRKFTLAKSRS